MPNRRFKPRRREGKFRDTRLIIIATEGKYTEKQYFEALALAENYRNSRIRVEIFSSEDNNSAPNHLIERLDKFKKEYELDKHDEFWVVVDVDNWRETLSEVAATCLQKDYLLAVSNPCFELWLLLHIATWSDYSEEQIKIFFDNIRDGLRKPLERELVKNVGEHSKSNLNVTLYIPHVERAIEQAKALDINPADRWTQAIGTRVYQVVESIIKTKRR
jgi:hypothetical protein